MKTSQPDAERLPYGVNELSPDVVPLSDKPRRVKCYANNCQQVLHTPTRAGKGDICPDHGIRCHYSSAGATYSYADSAHNITASAKAFKQKIVGHPFKYESHRLGLERSEDALSWNVFKSLQEAGSLARFASQITKEKCRFEPFLYLWGICVSDDQFEPWDLLIKARKRFEGNLPVRQFRTTSHGFGQSVERWSFWSGLSWSTLSYKWHPC